MKELVVLEYILSFKNGVADFGIDFEAYIEIRGTYYGAVCKITSFDPNMPFHLREIQWGIYNISSLKCNGFFDIVYFFSIFGRFFSSKSFLCVTTSIRTFSRNEE